MTENLINADLALKNCGGYESVVQEVMETFLSEAVKNRDDIVRLYTEQDWENFCIISHGLKTAALSAGALPLSNLAKKMEFAARENRIKDIDNSFDTFIDLINETLVFLEGYIKEY